MAELKMGTLFNRDLVSQLFVKTKGHSALAKLSVAKPVPFVGNDVFVFNIDGEVNIVAESAAKPAGAITLEPVAVTPIKVVYQARVTDEFMKASNEKRLEILGSYIEGCSKKMARALDLMGMHGVNPATGLPASVITHKLDDVQAVTVGASLDDSIEDAIALLGENDVNGIALSKTGANMLSKETVNGAKKYPSLAWGGTPDSLNGLSVDINTTVSANSSKDLAIVGDFDNAFRWGYAEEMNFEIIQYGDPDQTGKDLKAHNQICLRVEAFIGFAIMDDAAFARVVTQ